jgi:transcriptional regulator with XRE-family HTH domain
MSEEEVTKTIARNAKGLRKRMGLTLQEVAERAGIAKSYVWELEQGKQTNPSIAILMGLAKGLGCSVDGLIGAETYMKPQLRPEAMRIAVQVDQLLRDCLKSRLDKR